jgi:uncharacterized protein with PIN domain
MAFGQGSGQTAGHDFGDCFADALAIDRQEPLLFKADDLTTQTCAAFRRNSAEQEAAPSQLP